MDPFNIFRSFFGFPNNKRDFQDEFDRHFRDKPGQFNGEDDFDKFGQFSFQSPIFGMNSMMQEMDEIFNHMNSIMENLDHHAKHFKNHDDFPAISSSKSPDTLRDEMLKQPESTNKTKQITPETNGMLSQGKRKDTDLDGNFEEIFSNESHEDNSQNKNFFATPSKPRFFQKSISIKTVRTPDGRVETHRTERDSNGKEETTVTTYEDGKGYFGMKKPLENEQIPASLLKEEAPTLDTNRDSIFNKFFSGNFFQRKDS